MEEEIIFEESKHSTRFKFMVFVIILAILVGGILIFFRIFNFNIKRTVTYELGDTISFDVKDYLTNKPLNTKGYKLNVDNVTYDKDNKLTTKGEYTYQVSFNDNIKEGKIVVKDTKAPNVETLDLTVGVNEEFQLDDFLQKCDDYSLPCVVETKDSYDITKEGSYKLKLNIKDQENNSVTKDVTLTVKDGSSLKDDKSKDMKVASMDPTYNDWDNESYVIKFSMAFDPEDYENYRWSYYYEFLDSNYKDYLPSKYSNKSIKNTSIIALYNKYHYIVGFAARAELEDGKIVYLTNGE